MIVVGASLGGLRAVGTILSALNKDWSEPIAVVVHRAKESENLLSSVLQRYSPIPVIEVLDKEPLRGGRVYVAPPDYHLLVEADCFSLSVEAPVNYARPSIDVLFESAAFSLGAKAIAIALTGSSADGAAGAAAIAARGGRVIVQAPEGAESPVLPQAVLNRVPAAQVLTLDKIGPFLQQLNRPHH